MASLSLRWKQFRNRLREGLPVRYTMMVVVVIGVTLPAL